MTHNDEILILIIFLNLLIFYIIKKFSKSYSREKLSLKQYYQTFNHLIFFGFISLILTYPE